MLSITALANQILTDSEVHPDISRRNLYKALSKEVATEKTLKSLIQESMKNREELDEAHFSNLLAHAIEYFYILEHVKTPKPYHKFTEDDWHTELEKLLQDETYVKKISYFLSNKKTQTNKYQRYIGPASLIKLFFKSKPVDILDIGCSLNIGLLGLNANLKFNNIHDETPNSTITKLVEERMYISRGFGVDIDDPQVSYDWIIACNFYPGEAVALEEFTDTYKKIQEKSENIKFIRSTVSELGNVWKKMNLDKMDVVIASTVLYQLTPQERAGINAIVKNLLKDKGLFIINDFINIRDNALEWQKTWFDKKPTYKTILYRLNENDFEGPYEFIQWNNARCDKAYEGKDFKYIIEMSKGGE